MNLFNAELCPHLRQDGLEALFFEERYQDFRIRPLLLEFGNLVIDRHIGPQGHQLAGNIGNFLLVMDEVREARVHFGIETVIDNLLCDLVALGGQVVHRGGIRRRLAGLFIIRDRQFKLVDQHFLELLGRADTEFASSQFEYPRLAGIGLADCHRLDGFRVFRRLEKFIETAELVDQLGGRRFADSFDPRHVIGGITEQRLHINYPVGRNTEFVDHFVGADELVLHRVHHAHAGPDQLHQVLVGRHDGDVEPLFDGMARIGRDQVVGLEAFKFQTGQTIGTRRLADQVELRDQLFRRRRAMCLVFGIDVAAERFARSIEDHG